MTEMVLFSFRRAIVRKMANLNAGSSSLRFRSGDQRLPTLMDFSQHDKECSGEDGTDSVICCLQLEAFLLEVTLQPRASDSQVKGKQRGPAKGFPWNSKLFRATQREKLCFRSMSASYVNDDVHDDCVHSNSQCACISEQTSMHVAQRS